MPHARFIFNPRSGRNARDPRLLQHTRAWLARHLPDARLVLTEHPRHATELARHAIAEGCDLVVAIGGDGTLNEVAAALVHTPAALGLVPCGSGNGLGRHLGLPGPGRGAFHTLLHGRIREIDTGSVNGLPFFNAMGLGFDAEISHRFNQLTRRGLPAYIRTTCSALFQHRPESCLITPHPGPPLSCQTFILAIANSDQYGNDCYIAPGARVDDGLLDLTVIHRATWLNTAPLAARLFLGRIGGSSDVTRLRAPRFTLQRPAPGLIHTDGETHPLPANLDITVLPRSLRVLVPSPA